METAFAFYIHRRNKMKVLIAHMSAECNEHIQHTAGFEDFDIAYGQECIDKMHIEATFAKEGMEIIPSIYARTNPNGMIERPVFDFIANTIFDDVRKHLHEIDGIYLQLHGASGVLNLDCISGEHYIVKKLREITGSHMPIAMVMDPHGNLTKTLAEQLHIVRCYRESPHIDTIETEQIVAEKLCQLLKNRRPMKPVICKLPIMVGGERSVSSKEPMRTINQMLDEAEQDERVFSASYHVGYIRHDDSSLGAAVVVIPNYEKDREYCLSVAKNISEYAWNHRHEFQFSGNFDEPEESVRKTLAYEGKTAVITDSGDNCGAGGSGKNTIVLKELIRQYNGKKILVAGINDVFAHAYLSSHAIGDFVEFDLGENEDENSSPVHIRGTLIQTGMQMHNFGNTKLAGPCFTVRLEHTNLDIIVVNHNVQYGTMEQFHAAGLEFHDYDVVVVKMGYLDTYLIPETAYHNMALSDGPTIQRSEKIPFKLIYRPMWPIDSCEELSYID